MFYNYFKQVPPTALLLHFVLRGAGGFHPHLINRLEKDKVDKRKRRNGRASMRRCLLGVPWKLQRSLPSKLLSLVLRCFFFFFFEQLFFLTTQKKKRNLIIVDNLIDLSVCMLFFFLVFCKR